MADCKYYFLNYETSCVANIKDDVFVKKKKKRKSACKTCYVFFHFSCPLSIKTQSSLYAYREPDLLMNCEHLEQSAWPVIFFHLIKKNSLAWGQCCVVIRVYIILL